MFGSEKYRSFLKHPGFNGKSSAPPPPDYVGAAQATATGNLQAAQAASAANKVNQVTPYGNLTYTQTGTDPATGTPMWTATQSLSPGQQQLYNQNTQLSSGLLDTAQSGLNYASGLMSKPGVDISTLPSVGINPGQTYTDAIMSRLQPEQAAQRQQFQAQMANQGIDTGSQAYLNAQRLFNDQQAAQQAQAVTQGFNTGLAANQNSFNQQAYNQMLPVNVINALRTGNQVQTPSYVNAPQQATTQGADILGATQMGYNSQLGNVNAQNAQAAQTNGAIGSAALAAFML